MMMRTADMTYGYNIYNFFPEIKSPGEELDGLSSTVATSGYKNEAEVQSVSHVG